MLIDFVRDSVLQCFCHSCKAPLSIIATQRTGAMPTKKPSGKGKPRTKQPKKKVKFITTEIRAQEKTKGGLRYEVILADVSSESKRVSLSADQNEETLAPTVNPEVVLRIENKLRAAEERRLSIEAEKIAKQQARLIKIEEAARKRDSLTTSFVNSTRESLDKKLNRGEEKREAIIADIKSKVKDHLVGVDNTRQKNLQQMLEMRTAIEEKIKAAENHRQENYQKLVERLKEHDEQINRARQSLSRKSQSLEATIQAKLDNASERRKTLEQEQLDKIRDHWERVLLAREEKKAKGQINAANDQVPKAQETASSG